MSTARRQQLGGFHVFDHAATGLACSLPATSMRQREAELRKLLASATRIYESEEGIIGEFSGTDEMAQALLDAVLFERRCCAPLTYALIFAPDHTNVALKIQAAPQYRAIIKAWLASEGRNVASPLPLGTSGRFRRIAGQFWATLLWLRGAMRCRCGISCL